MLIWVQGNQIEERQISSVSGSTVQFDSTDIKSYDERDGKAAIIGSVKAVDTPGEFARIASNKAIVYPRPGGGAISIGSGRGGFDIAGKSYVTVTGFRFEHGTGQIGSTRQGIAFFASTGNFSNFLVEDNEFFAYALRSGYGVVQLASLNSFTFRLNTIQDVFGGSGIRFGSSNNVLAERNRISRVGRTGIMLNGSDNSIVRYNVVANVTGVHGNAMSIYGDARNNQMVSNCVYNSTRPLTFHGDGTLDTPNGYTFTGNILVAAEDGRAAIYSWGAKTDNVLIENNVMLSPLAGAILNGTDRNVTARFNLGNPILINGTADPSWTITGNQVATYASKAGYNLSLSQCSGPGPNGALNITTW